MSFIMHLLCRRLLPLERIVIVPALVVFAMLFCALATPASAQESPIKISIGTETLDLGAQAAADAVEADGAASGLRLHVAGPAQIEIEAARAGLECRRLRRSAVRSG